MVSLRERHPRPSYASIHEGLQNLSSDEDESGAPGSAPAGEGEAGAEEPASDEDAQSSFSSGGSSAFDPEAEKERRRPKSGVPSAREDARQPSSSPDSLFDDEDMVDEDGEPDAGEHPDVAQRPRAASTVSIVEIKPSIRPKSAKAAPTTFPGTSEIARLPPIYRDLIQQSTKDLTKPPLPSKAPNQGWLFRILKAESLPSGPGTPYTARLVRPPRHRQVGEVKRTAEPEDALEREEARQNRNWELMGTYPLLSPWQTWEGEGYWPETYVGRRGAGESSRPKKKSRLLDPDEWITRDEVRMGLDNVGRLPSSHLTLLDAKSALPHGPRHELTIRRAALHIPAVADGAVRSRIRCHIGPHGAQRRVDLSAFDHRPIHDYHPAAAGFLFNAGGPVWGIDWCPYPQRLSAAQNFRQYLAVSTLPDIDTRPTLGTKGPADAPGNIQIWSMIPPASPQADGDEPMDGNDAKGRMRCEMVLCVQGGPVMDLRWMPMGAWDEYEPGGPAGQSLPKLGIIAALHCDGSVSFWPVPHPLAVKQARGVAPTQTLYVHLSAPLLTVAIPDACCTCLDWMTGSRLAVGLSNGHVAVWDVLDALRSGQSDVLPAVYAAVSLSGIRDIAAAHTPSSDGAGQARWGTDPFFLVCGGWDGSTVILDVRDPDFPIEFNRSRASSMAVAWSSQLGSPFYIDTEYFLVMYKLRGMGEGKGQYMAFQQGPVWGIGTSDYHTMLLTAGCDGSVLLSNCKQGFHRGRGEASCHGNNGHLGGADLQGLMQQRMMQMDYDLHTGEYRLLDNFLPEHISLEVTLNRVAKDKAKSSNPMLMKSASWLPQVAVHRVGMPLVRRVGWDGSNGSKGGSGEVKFQESPNGRLSLLASFMLPRSQCKLRKRHVELAAQDDVEVVRKHLSSSSMSSSLALYACGSNASGQLGIGHLDDVHRLTACHLDPSVHDALAGHRVEVVDLCGSSAHSLLLLRLTEPDPSGRSQKQPRTLLLGAGTNTLGQLGPRCRLWADTRPELAYKPLDLLTPLGLTHDEWEPVKVATTWTTSFAVYRRTGTPPPDAPAAAGSSSDQAAGGSSIPPPTQMVVACGSSDFGECGLPPSSHQVGRVAITTPGDMPSIVDLALAPGETVEHIRGGQRHVVCVVRGTSGAQRVVGWGANRRGELDPLGAAPAPPPAAPSPPDGDKRKGKAAVRSTTLTPTVLPLRLEPREAVAHLALGSGHTVVRLSSGRLAAWGSDLKGQIAGLDEATGVAQVAATWGGTYLLDARRILWSQGSDSHGQLLRSTDGAGPRGQVDLAAYSEGEQGIVSLRTGSEHVLLQLGREGGPDEVWAGGWNEHGNLGLGDTTDRPALERVPLPAGVRRVRGVWGGLAATWIWVEG